MAGLGDLDRPLLEERHHPVLPWVVAALLALAVVGVAAAFYYAPLAAGTELSCPEQAELVPAVESEDGAAGAPVCLLPHVPGQTVTFGVGVTNEGPLPVAVHGVAFGGVVEELLEVVEVRTSEVGGGPGERLEPFGLAPGAHVVLTVEARLLPCDTQPEGTVVTVPTLPVRTSFIGLARTTEVPLGTDLALLLEACTP